MCQKGFDVLNKKDDDEFHGHRQIKENIIGGVHTGKVTPTKLPSDLYEETAKVLKRGAYKGFGGTLAKFEFDTSDFEMINDLRTNIYMFSAAKTFQTTLEMSEALVDKEGNVLPFKEFKEAAGEIFDKYNGEEGELNGYLKAEYDTAITQSRAASKWLDIQNNKKNFPYLKYVAVMDAHTCEICAPLDGITLPEDDPFWDENFGAQHFFCECTVETLDQQDADEEGVSDQDEVSEAVEKSQETKNPLFNMNPGKDRAVFQDTGKNKHPYFEVSKKYKDLAGNNFDLPIPEKD